MVASSTEPQENGMFALLRVCWQVLVIEILDEFFYLEAKLLIQDEGWVCG
jgi:hypothetical protein